MQSVLWYNTPYIYQGEPEIEFFLYLPTVWDETKVIDGKIGEYSVFVRRRGNDWFLSCITNERERELNISLSFLDKNKSYTASIYADGVRNEEGRTSVVISSQKVGEGTVLHATIAPSGGQDIKIVNQ
jgi:alpha-glucosidase